MTRWIAYDEEGTVAAAARTKTAVGFQRGEALGAAVESRGPAVVILPSDDRNHLTLLRIRPVARARAEETPVIEASGILGLTDRVVLHEEPEDTKVNWWSRIAGRRRKA
jgi:hypothetical protein